MKLRFHCHTPFALCIKSGDFQINEALFWITMNLRCAIVLIHVYYYTIQVISVLPSQKSQEFVRSSLFRISISTRSNKSARLLGIIKTSNWAIHWSIHHAATLLKTGLCCLAQLCTISNPELELKIPTVATCGSYWCCGLKLYISSCNYYYYRAHGSWCYICM